MPAKSSSDSLALAFKAGVTGRTPNNGRVVRFDTPKLLYAQLHDNTIARRDDSTLEICHCGYLTAVTTARLNTIISAFSIPGRIYRAGGKMAYGEIFPNGSKKVRGVPESLGNLSFNIATGQLVEDGK